MRHLSDGALRRLYDEPYALDEETRAHYNECQACRSRFAVVADDARHAMALLAVPGATVDPAGALGRVQARTRPVPSRFAAIRGDWRRPVVGGLAAAAVAGALVATMAFTPIAANLVKIFQPTQVQTVTISQGDLTGLDAFSNWGTVKWTRQPTLQQVDSASAAAHVSSLPAIAVDASKLPAGVSAAQVSYAAVGQASGSVTFNGSAPSKINGSTLRVEVGPAETAVYGDLSKLIQSAGGAAGGTAANGTPEGGSQDAAQAGSGQRGLGRAEQALASAGPIVAIAEVKAPVVSSTGASVADIKSALLSQPGLSPSVRAAISDIDNPAGNLPIPVPAGQVNAHSVKVQGVNGTAVGDNTGLGSGVIWIKNGRVYGVAGTVPEDQLLTLANSLT